MVGIRGTNSQIYMKNLKGALHLHLRLPFVVYERLPWDFRSYISIEPKADLMQHAGKVGGKNVGNLFLQIYKSKKKHKGSFCEGLMFCGTYQYPYQ